MTTLEKILQDIEECRIIASLDGNFNSSASFEKCEEIIKKHLSRENHTETTRQSRDNGWMPCSERMPEESLNSVIGWDEYRERCCFVQYYNGRWVLGNDTEPVKIIAWRPLPEPYKPPV